MARYALRNQAKIKKALGEKFLNLLIVSLDKHFERIDALISTHFDEEDNRTYMSVAHPQGGNGAEFLFVVIRKTFDVYNLAYFKEIK